MGKIIKNGVEYSYSPLPNAAGVTYNNLNSGLSATTAQGAIDEIVDNLFILKSFTTTYSIAASGTTNFSASFITVPDGYSIAAIAGVSTNQGSTVLASIRPTTGSSSWAFELKNTTATAYNNQIFWIRILFVKSNFISIQ